MTGHDRLHSPSPDTSLSSDDDANYEVIDQEYRVTPPSGDFAVHEANEEEPSGSAPIVVGGGKVKYGLEEYISGLERTIICLQHDQEHVSEVKRRGEVEKAYLRERLDAEKAEKENMTKKIDELEMNLERMRFFREEESKRMQAEVKRLEEALENHSDDLDSALKQRDEKDVEIHHLNRIIDDQMLDERQSDIVNATINLENELRTTKRNLDSREKLVDRIKSILKGETMMPRSETVETIVDKNDKSLDDNDQKTEEKMTKDDFKKQLAIEKKKINQKISDQNFAIFLIFLELIIPIVFIHFLPTITTPDIMNGDRRLKMLLTIGFAKLYCIALIGFSFMYEFSAGLYWMRTLFLAINAVWMFFPTSQYELIVLSLKSILVPFCMVLMRNELSRSCDSIFNYFEGAFGSLPKDERALTFVFCNGANGDIGFDFKQTESGFVIDKIHAASDALRKGVREGDRIVQINGVRIEGFSEAYVKIMMMSVRGRVRMEVKRRN